MYTNAVHYTCFGTHFKSFCLSKKKLSRPHCLKKTFSHHICTFYSVCNTEKHVVDYKSGLNDGSQPRRFLTTTRNVSEKLHRYAPLSK